MFSLLQPAAVLAAPGCAAIHGGLAAIAGDAPVERSQPVLQLRCMAMLRHLPHTTTVVLLPGSPPSTPRLKGP